MPYPADQIDKLDEELNFSMLESKQDTTKGILRSDLYEALSVEGMQALIENGTLKAADFLVKSKDRKRYIALSTDYAKRIVEEASSYVGVHFFEHEHIIEVAREIQGIIRTQEKIQLLQTLPQEYITILKFYNQHPYWEFIGYGSSHSKSVECWTESYHKYIGPCYKRYPAEGTYREALDLILQEKFALGFNLTLQERMAYPVIRELNKHEKIVARELMVADDKFFKVIERVQHPIVQALNQNEELITFWDVLDDETFERIITRACDKSVRDMLVQEKLNIADLIYGSDIGFIRRVTEKTGSFTSVPTNCDDSRSIISLYRGENHLKPIKSVIALSSSTVTDTITKEPFAYVTVSSDFKITYFAGKRREYTFFYEENPNGFATEFNDKNAVVQFNYKNAAFRSSGENTNSGCKALVVLVGNDIKYSPESDCIVGEDIIGYAKAAPSCTEKQLRKIEYDVKSRLPKDETLQQQASIGQLMQELSVTAAESVAITGIMLLTRDVMLARGYSPKAASRGAYLVNQFFIACMVARSLWGGAGYLTSILPLLMLNIIYHGLTKTGLTSNRTASWCSTATSIATHVYTGSGIFKAVAHFGVSSSASYVTSLGEKKFANTYLTGR